LIEPQDAEEANNANKVRQNELQRLYRESNSRRRKMKEVATTFDAESMSVLEHLKLCDLRCFRRLLPDGGQWTEIDDLAVMLHNGTFEAGNDIVAKLLQLDLLREGCPLIKKLEQAKDSMRGNGYGRLMRAIYYLERTLNQKNVNLESLKKRREEKAQGKKDQ
jgi:hypothetical protein